jgi:hypothetical protein
MPTFRATIRIRGINPFVAVSAARASRIKPGWRKPLPVVVRVNGKPAEEPWRINMMPAGDGSFYLYLHGDVRRASGTKVGDVVTVEVAFDSAYRGGPLTPIPARLRNALRANPPAAAAWKALSPSRQKEIVRYLVALKSAEARERNVVRVLRMLSKGAEKPAAGVFSDRGLYRSR